MGAGRRCKCGHLEERHHWFLMSGKKYWICKIECPCKRYRPATPEALR